MTACLSPGDAVAVVFWLLFFTVPAVLLRHQAAERRRAERRAVLYPPLPGEVVPPER